MSLSSCRHQGLHFVGLVWWLKPSFIKKEPGIHWFCCGHPLESLSLAWWNFVSPVGTLHLSLKFWGCEKKTVKPGFPSEATWESLQWIQVPMKQFLVVCPMQGFVSIFSFSSDIAWGFTSDCWDPGSEAQSLPLFCWVKFFFARLPWSWKWKTGPKILEKYYVCCFFAGWIDNHGHDFQSCHTSKVTCWGEKWQNVTLPWKHVVVAPWVKLWPARIDNRKPSRKVNSRVEIGMFWGAGWISDISGFLSYWKHRQFCWLLQEKSWVPTTM